MPRSGTLRLIKRLVPVRSISAEVVRGPDSGAGACQESEPLTVGSARDNTLSLSDSTVSRYHLEFRTEDDGVLVVDHGSTNGTRVGAVTIRAAFVASGTVLSLGNTRLLLTFGEPDLRTEAPEAPLAGIVGGTPAMQKLASSVRRAAGSQAAVLIVGESGTGKELIARAIHAESPRAAKPLITVDCGALSPTLIASQLFGHERGSFTGADHQHLGAFEQAHGGTLFLDEIGELPIELQSHLLGVLERRSLVRVGGKERISVDVRLVAASNRDLRAEVNADRFRLDLYYRLAVVCLRVPPLRERVSDLPLLIEQFLREADFTGSVEEVVPPELMGTLARHRWTGNVRELRNFIQSRLAMGEGVPAGASMPPSAKEGSAHAVPVAVEQPFAAARAHALEEFERVYLRHRLRQAEGNVSRAARDAGMARSYINSLIRRHNIR